MNITEIIKGINWISVAVVTIIPFITGAIWHGKAVFGKAWKEDAKPSSEGLQKLTFVRVFGFSALYYFFGFSVLDIIIGSESTFLTGLLTGVAVGVGFSAASVSISHLFAGRPMRLIILDSAFYVLNYAFCGSILGLW